MKLKWELNITFISELNSKMLEMAGGIINNIGLFSSKDNFSYIPKTS